MNTEYLKRIRERKVKQEAKAAAETEEKTTAEKESAVAYPDKENVNDEFPWRKTRKQ